MLHVELMKVEHLINELNTSKEVNYDGLLNGLKKMNAELHIDKISDKYKRILYLELVVHTLKLSCNQILTSLNDNKIKQAVHNVVTKVVRNVAGYKNDSSIIVVNELLEEWNEIATSIKQSNGAGVN